MAFDIMSLFSPQAVNRLLQPQQSAQGIQNFLANPAVQQPQMAPPLPPPVSIGPAPSVAPAPVDPMQTAAVAAPQVAPVQQPANQPFFNDERKAMLGDIFTGWAMGSTPSESIAMGAKLVAANKGTRKNVNETVNWLKGKGMDEQQAKMLAGSPPALNEYLKQMIGGDKQKPIEVGGRLIDPTTYKVIADFSDPNAKLTSDQREYKAAQEQGFTGSFMDYQIKMKEAGRNQVNIDTGAKLPSGFRWLDPNKQELGVEPIPGGPATQVPGELAARVGMGDNFLKNDLPFLRKPESLEAATGPIDRTQAYFGIGEPGVVERKFQSGVEVLSRLLSGAGMTQVEIDEKSRRYMPTKYDTPESLKTKLDQLEAEIKAAGDAAMRGRGGSIMTSPSAGVRKYNPQTGMIE
ncbi:hypothetical protein V6R85_01475 [Agrobacterium sp. CCNWLW32]|uniref:hypothetical protein n=1 Tax=Agrobacterium sp. CCNWLW32 TaxID=3122072 RepID=UPI00300FB92D